MGKKRVLAIIISMTLLGSMLPIDTVSEAFAMETAVGQEESNNDASEISQEVEMCSDGFFLRKEVKSIEEMSESESIANSAMRLYKGSITNTNNQAVVLGNALNKEMQKYLSGKSSAVSVSRRLPISVTIGYRELQLQSTIHVDLSSYMSQLLVTGDDVSEELEWLMMAIADYPNLATFFTFISVAYSQDRAGNYYLASLDIYSPVAADDIIEVTKSYKEKLEELISVPSTDATMTDMEKLLYIHDQVTTEAEYTDTEGPAMKHTSIGALLEHDCVCQGYSSVFSNAANKLGFDCEYTVSSEHAWNAVKLDEKWYYVDTTWDDPVGEALDYTDHEYFLTDLDVFTEYGVTMHTLEYIYSAYKEIPSNFGSAYENIFPKTDRITKQMSYLDGTWYYSDGNQIMTWDGESDISLVFTDIPSGTDVCCDVYNGILYYSNSTGLYQYVEDGEDRQLSDDSISEMIIMSNVIHYIAGDVTKTYELEAMEVTVSDDDVDDDDNNDDNDNGSVSNDDTKNNGTITSSDQSTGASDSTMIEYNITYVLNGGKNNSSNPSTYGSTGKVTLKKPTRKGYLFAGWYLDSAFRTKAGVLSGGNYTVYAKWTKVKVLKVKKGSIQSGKKKLKIKWSKLKNVSGYQIVYTIKKNSSSKKKSIIVKSTSKKKTITKLKSKKKYSVKIRAFRYDSTGKKVYGKYTKYKVCKTK